MPENEQTWEALMSGGPRWMYVTWLDYEEPERVIFLEAFDDGDPEGAARIYSLEAKTVEVVYPAQLSEIHPNAAAEVEARQIEELAILLWGAIGAHETAGKADGWDEQRITRLRSSWSRLKHSRWIEPYQKAAASLRPYFIAALRGEVGR